MRWFRTLRSRMLLLVALSALPALAAVWLVSSAYMDGGLAHRTAYGLLLLVVILVATAGILISRALVRRDVQPLVELAGAFARGDVPEHSPPYHGPDELRALRDAMLDSARARTASEFALQASLEKLDTYFRNSPMAFLELDRNFRIRLWTPQAERVFGWPAEEAIGRTPQELGILHPEDTGQVDSMLKSVMASGGYVVNHNRNRTRGGKVIWCEWHNSVVLDASGEFESIVCIALDETRRINAAEDVARREREYRLLFAGNPSPMWVYDPTSWRFLAVNKAAVERYGWSEREFMAMTLRDIRTPEESVRLESWLENRTSRDIIGAGIWTHRGKDGRELKVEITSDDIVWEGRPARIVVAHDVSERERHRLDREQLNRELESRIADRNAEIEALGVAVSRDLRGVLQASDTAQAMERLIEDMNLLVRASHEELEPEPVDLSALASAVTVELDPEGRADFRIAPGMRVRADPGLLRVAVGKLLAVALESCAGSDTPVIEVGVAQHGSGPVHHVRHDGNSGHADGGIAMATAYRVIARHGGRIWVEAEEDAGTVVYFTLEGAP
jgi:PAS domain S-box-containing protein